MAKNVLLALIVITSVVFAIVYTSAQMYAVAAVAVALGAVWLLLEAQTEYRVAVVFFLAFVALAVLGTLYQSSAVLILFGLTTDLAAWDLSRFRRRIAGVAEADAAALLATNHLRKLAITAAAGFLIALLPLLIELSINFVVLLLFVLLTIIALRRSMFALRGSDRGV